MLDTSYVVVYNTNIVNNNKIVNDLEVMKNG